MVIGIEGYGVYVPPLRIKVDEIVNTWHNSSTPYLHYLQNILKLRERAFCDFDEDVITMAVNAGKNAIKSSGISPKDLGSIIFGSHTSPYVMKASGTIILEALNGPGSAVVGDVQFSNKSGTLAIRLCAALASQGVESNLAIASDNVSIHTEPGDSFEYPASAGAAAFLIGKNDVIAEIEGFETFNSDTPDIYRLEGDRYLTTGGDAMLNTDVGMPSHIATATKTLMKKLNCKPGDFDYAVFHQTYGVTSLSIGRAFGFEKAQIAPGVFAENLGDTGSSSTLIGLAKVLDQAKGGQKILVVSYGSGAGSDAIALRVTDKISDVRGKSPTVQSLIENKMYMDYANYAKLERKYQRKAGE